MSYGEGREGYKKAHLQRELARLKRNREPIQEELKSVDENIKKIEKELDRLKDVKAIETKNFLF